MQKDWRNCNPILEEWMPSEFKLPHSRKKLWKYIRISLIPFTIMFVFFALYIFGVSPWNDKHDILFVGLAQTVGFVTSLIIAMYQFSGSKDISRGNFIVQLNKTFVENSEYIALYNALQNCLDNKCKCAYKCNKISNI